MYPPRSLLCRHRQSLPDNHPLCHFHMRYFCYELQVLFKIKKSLS
jgi:hypothetical protein